MATPKWFDYATYKVNKLAQLQELDSSWTMTKMEEAFAKAGFEGTDGYYQHFQKYGHREDVSPNKLFEADYYYEAKALQYYQEQGIAQDVILDDIKAYAARVEGLIKAAGMDAWTHYIKYGTKEGINPSSGFNTSEYMQEKYEAWVKTDAGKGKTMDDMYKAFKDANLNALEHAFQFGTDSTTATAGEAQCWTDATHTELTEAVGTNDDPIVDPATEGETFTLTTGPDNIKGTDGDDEVNGYIDTDGNGTTFSAADTIDGGKGDDTFNLTVEDKGAGGAGTFPAATVKNVEKFMIRDVTTLASTYDFEAIDGETEVWSNVSSTTHANEGNHITFANLGTGTIVGVKGNGTAKNLASVEFSMAKTKDAVNVVVDGGVNNNAQGAEAVAPVQILNVGGEAKEATLTSTGKANTLAGVTLAGTGTNTIKQLTVDAQSALNANLDQNDFAATAVMTVKGEGHATLLGFAGNTVDASANSGGLTTDTVDGVTKTLTGSSAADHITLNGALASGATVNLGAGDDVLTGGDANSVDAKGKVDGGAGTDSISAAVVTVGNAANLLNFELLDITAATTAGHPVDVELMTGSKIQGLTIAGGAGGDAEVKNVATGSTLTVTGNDAASTNTVGIKGAAASTSDTFNIKFDGKTGGNADDGNAHYIAGTLVLNDVETVNIVSGGVQYTDNALVLTDTNSAATTTSLRTLNISGERDLDLTFGQIGSDPKGDGSDGFAKLDASSMTGNLTVEIDAATATVTSGLTVNTGSGKDMVTLTDAIKATVNAGKGADYIISGDNGGTFDLGADTDADVVSVKAAIATGTAETDWIDATVKNFAAADRLGLSDGAAVKAASKITLTTEQNLADALATATATADNGDVTWFQFKGNTYVVENEGGAGITSDDLVVELVGLVDLSTATVKAGVDESAAGGWNLVGNQLLGLA